MTAVSLYSRLKHGRVNLYFKLFVPVQTLKVELGIIIQLYRMLNSVSSAVVGDYSQKKYTDQLYIMSM